MRIKIEEHEIAPLIAYIRQVSGIALDSSKVYLLENRLSTLLQQHNISHYQDLLRLARNDASGRIRNALIDAITTNETSFFRDKKPFDLMAHKLFADHFEVSGKQLNILCAACSTGQEVYSLSIILKELLGSFNGYRIKILGTDISDAAIAKASMGRYTPFELGRGLTPDNLKRYFTKEDRTWKINDELRSIVQFRKANILEPLRMGAFDMILCRNVAIYFSKEDRSMMYNHMARQLKSRGIFLIGATETLHGLTTCFERMEFHGAVYYRKVKNPDG